MTGAAEHPAAAGIGMEAWSRAVFGTVTLPQAVTRDLDLVSLAPLPVVPMPTMVEVMEMAADAREAWMRKAFRARKGRRARGGEI